MAHTERADKRARRGEHQTRGATIGRQTRSRPGRLSRRPALLARGCKDVQWAAIQSNSTEEQFRLAACPACGQPHDYVLQILSEGPDVPVLGTPHDAASEPKVDVFQVNLSCPVTGRRFTESVEVPRIPGRRVYRVEAVSGASDQPPAPPAVDWQKMFNDWATASANNGREFCRAMVTVSTGAIAVTYGVTKVLAGGAATLANPLSILVVLGAAAFLVSAILFMLGARPEYTNLRSSGGDYAEAFENYRAERLRHLSNFITAGAVFFVVGVVIAIVSFTYQLSVAASPPASPTPVRVELTTPLPVILVTPAPSQ